MTVQILKKGGNSPAVRIPVAIMQSAQLALDQAVEVRAEGGRIIIEPVAPAFILDDLLDGITVENQHAEVDFGILQGQKQSALADIKNRWQAENWWDEPNGKSARQAKAIYE